LGNWGSGKLIIKRPFGHFGLKPWPLLPGLKGLWKLIPPIKGSPGKPFLGGILFGKFALD